MSVSSEQMIEYFDLNLKELEVDEVEGMDPPETIIYEKPNSMSHVYNYIELTNWLCAAMPIAYLLVNAMIERYSNGDKGSLAYINMNDKKNYRRGKKLYP